MTQSLALRPKTSGEYISSAFAGGTTNVPGVVALATAATNNVAYDDFNIDAGLVKVSVTGSAGGHSNAGVQAGGGEVPRRLPGAKDAGQASDALLPRGELLRINESLRRENQQLRMQAQQAEEIERAADRREHAEGEHVYLEQTEGLQVVLVPLDDAAPGHRDPDGEAYEHVAEHALEEGDPQLRRCPPREDPELAVPVTANEGKEIEGGASQRWKPRQGEE